MLNDSDIPENAYVNADEVTFIEPLDNIVCDVCLEQNLTENIHIQRCTTCNDEYCMHHSSVIDPGQCEQCCSDVKVEISTIKKVIIDSKVGHIRSRKARQITLGGLHWLFAQRKIQDMGDDDLIRAIEYHRAIYDSLIYEREKRRAETFHRNANKPFKVPQNHSTTTKTVKTVKTVQAKTAPTAEGMNTQFKALIDAGFTKEQIIALIMGKKK